MYNSKPSEEILLTTYGKAGLSPLRLHYFWRSSVKIKVPLYLTSENMTSRQRWVLKNKAFRVSRVYSSVAPLARHEQSLRAAGRQIDSWRREKLRVQIWSKSSRQARGQPSGLRVGFNRAVVKECRGVSKYTPKIRKETKTARTVQGGRRPGLGSFYFRTFSRMETIHRGQQRTPENQNRAFCRT